MNRSCWQRWLEGFRFDSRRAKDAPLRRPEFKPRLELLESRTLMDAGLANLSLGAALRVAETVETNDQISEAVRLGNMTQQRVHSGATIDSSTDVDMFSFAVAAGQRIAFDLDRPAGGRLDSYIRLFDARGSQLARNDDGPTPGEPSSLESYLEFTFATSGTYYLGVSGDGNELAANHNGPTPGEPDSTESYLDFTFNAAGRYFLGVSGFGNVSYDPVTGNGDGDGSSGGYTLTLNTDQPTDGRRVLYLNFDGARMSWDDLIRWSAGWSFGVGHLDPERDGIRVQPS